MMNNELNMQKNSQRGKFVVNSYVGRNSRHRQSILFINCVIDFIIYLFYFILFSLNR